MVAWRHSTTPCSGFEKLEKGGDCDVMWYANLSLADRIVLQSRIVTIVAGMSAKDCSVLRPVLFAVANQLT
jgi:hypothetical protein